MSLSKKNPKIFLAAVEPSADSNGAALITALKQMHPQIELSGCGGAAMEKTGFTSLFPIDEFAVMGFTDVVRVVPKAFERAKQVGEFCRDNEIDIAVFIDGWTFSRICAARIRKLSPKTKIIKYSAPQIWASRPERIEFVKQHFDLVLALLPFEPALFEAHGVPTIFVGNPNYEAVLASETNIDFREKYGLKNNRILTILPGSRKSEINFLMDPFLQVAQALVAKYSDLRIIIPVAGAVANLVKEKLKNWTMPVVVVEADEKIAAFKASDVALTASGTVATELALCQVPMVVAYKVDALTNFWAKRVMIADYLTILNIAAGREIVPEFLQEDCTAEYLTEAVERLLTNTQAVEEQRRAFVEYEKSLNLSEGSAAKRAAEAVLCLLN